MNIITQENIKVKLNNKETIVKVCERQGNEGKPNGLYGVYPFVHFYPTGDISLHLFGVKIKFKVPHRPSNNGNAYTGETETMSRNSRVRLIRKTSALEFLGYRPTHMLTLTLPSEKFEMLTDTEKVATWNYAKSFFLRKLSKISDVKSHLFFQEFQGRGAPHLHVLLDIGTLNDSEWQAYLERFIAIWKKALKWDEGKEFPNQSVDFARLRKPDFRYAREYASKLDQKNAPFPARWGRWWGTAGEWQKVKYDETFDVELPREIKQNVLAIRENMSWISWSKLESLDKGLFDRIMFFVEHGQKKEKRTMERVEFERMIEKLERIQQLRQQKENELEKIKRIAKIRYQAYLDVGRKGTKYWMDWVQKYPIENFLLMNDDEIKKIFDTEVERAKLQKHMKSNRNQKKEHNLKFDVNGAIFIDNTANYSDY